MLRPSDLAIIADDLTGACDVAACFAAALGSVSVQVSPEHRPRRSRSRDSSAPEVINTQSRLLPPARSRALLRRIGRAIAAKPVILKKIDSALRGPVGAELEGLLEAIGPRRTIVAPAIPRIGKTTRAGRQYDCGVPINMASFGADPASPVRSADITEIIAQTGDIQYEIGDAETDDDLRRLVDAALAGGQKLLLVGSLGIADAVAAQISGLPHVNVRACGGQRVLILCGSRYKQSLDQVEYAVLRGEAIAQEIVLDEHGASHLARHEDSAPLIVRLTLPRAEGGGGLPIHGLQEKASHLAKAIQRLEPDSMGVIGGETAYLLLTQLDTGRLRVCGRMADVVAYGVIEDGPLAGCPFATKGGSVGPVTAIVQMIQHLRKGIGATDETDPRDHDGRRGRHRP